MAGSRREAVGSIIKRIQGLLRSGAMKEEDRPVWYDVIQAFPPKPVPPPTKVQKILYPEDHIRVQFHRVYSSRGVTSLSDQSFKSIPDKFVDTYLELHEKQAAPPDELFELTAESLNKQGIKLIKNDAIPVNKRNRERARPLDITNFFPEKT